PRADRHTAARTAMSLPAIHPCTRRYAVEPVLHQPMRLREHAVKLLVGDLRERMPRRHSLRPETLDLPDVPDAADEPLVQQRVAGLARLVDAAQVVQHRVEVRRPREDVRTDAARNTAVEPEH